MNRLRIAALRQNAVVEDIDMRAPRDLDIALFQKLVAGDWYQNLLGKGWIACALGHKACRENRSVIYRRLPRLFDALVLAAATDSMPASSKCWRVSICSFSTTGALRQCCPSSAAISWRPWRPRTAAAQPS